MTRYGSLEKKPRTGLKERLNEIYFEHHSDFSEQEYLVLLQVKEALSNSGRAWTKRFDLVEDKLQDVELSNAGRNYINNLLDETYAHIKSTAKTSKQIKNFARAGIKNHHLSREYSNNLEKISISASKTTPNILYEGKNPVAAKIFPNDGETIISPTRDLGDSLTQRSDSQDIETGEKPKIDYLLTGKRAIAAGLLIGASAFAVYQVAGCAEENSQSKKRQIAPKTQ